MTDEKQKGWPFLGMVVKCGEQQVTGFSWCLLPKFVGTFLKVEILQMMHQFKDALKV